MRIRGTAARLCLAGAASAAIPVIAIASETISYAMTPKGDW